MIEHHTHKLAETIKRLLRRRAIGPLRKIVNKIHEGDLSFLFRFLSLSEQLTLFDLIKDKEKQGYILSEIDRDTFLALVKDMSTAVLIDIIENMPSDDAADLIDELPPEKADAILEGMRKEESEEVEGLLKYQDKTAGRIMVTDFIALKEDTTARDAIISLQKEYSDVEMPFYLYVVDEEGRLVGICSLRQLVVVAPSTLLKSLMTKDVIYVQTKMDQEDVAKIVARYNILAVPVTDDNKKLVGIITVDDVIDIIREEATEDILKMVGAGEEFVETKSVFRSSRTRLPWLFVSCMGGLFAFYIIGIFEQALMQAAFLATFIPIIMGMGGNVGTQSSTIVVRGLATGRLHLRHFTTIVLKELSVGAVLGIFYGLLIGIVAHIRYAKWELGLIVCIAVISSISLAALIGSMVPLCLAKFRIDPAVATGPFVTTSIDIISVFLYFKLATSYLL